MDFYLERTLLAIDKATDGISASELSWHSTQKWSAAQVLEHLSLAFSSTSKFAERLLAAGVVESPVPSVRQRAVVFIVVELGLFPSGREAPEFTKPRGLDPSRAVETIRSKLIEMDGRLGELERRFGSRVRAAHPILGPMSLRQWRKFHWVHTRHHMKQVTYLRAQSAIAEQASTGR
jgi:hypothetical protein